MEFFYTLNGTMDLKGALDQNPIPFYEEQIDAVLKKLTKKK